MLHKLLRPFKDFLVNDTRAGFTVELVMVLPLLLWGYFGMFVLFEGYRSLSSNIRASYTISDLLSRETDGITSAYINGLNDIQDILTQSPHRTVLRVSVFSYDQGSGTHTLEWSEATEGKSAIVAGSDEETTALGHLPVMNDSQHMIVVETWVAFVPFFNLTLSTLFDNDPEDERVAFGPFYFESLVTTRPRFADQLCWQNCF